MKGLEQININTTNHVKSQNKTNFNIIKKGFTDSKEKQINSIGLQNLGQNIKIINFGSIFNNNREDEKPTKNKITRLK